jgi:hypothetical protein
MLAPETTAPSYKDCVYYMAAADLMAKPTDTMKATDLNTPLRYETELMASRWCVPSSKALEDGAIKEFKKQFDQYFAGAGLAQHLGDIVAAKEVLLYALLTAFLIGFIYLLVLRVLGGPIIYISIVAIIGGCAYGGYMLFETA